MVQMWHTVAVYSGRGLQQPEKLSCRWLTAAVTTLSWYGNTAPAGIATVPAEVAELCCPPDVFLILACPGHSTPPSTALVKGRE